MNFNKHFELRDRHAFLSPSQYHWIRYDEGKLIERFLNKMAAQRGTELHALAHEMIRLGIRPQRSEKTFNKYVNDVIGFRMVPEQILYYSPNCFGTADAMSFRKNLLRIFDLKTGDTPASLDQLYVYAALFCLEYGVRPDSIEYDLRIYQADEVHPAEVDFKDIVVIMDKIKTFDRIIEEKRAEVE